LHCSEWFAIYLQKKQSVWLTFSHKTAQKRCVAFWVTYSIQLILVGLSSGSHANTVTRLVSQFQASNFHSSNSREADSTILLYALGFGAHLCYSAP